MSWRSEAHNAIGPINPYPAKAGEGDVAAYGEDLRFFLSYATPPEASPPRTEMSPKLADRVAQKRGEAPRTGISHRPWSSFRGMPQTYLDLELSENLERLDLPAGGEFLIVQTARHRSDVWIAEGFDPDLN